MPGRRVQRRATSVSLVTAYTRPVIEPRVFVDAAGDPIPYGSRWPGSPPEDTYSVTSDLERFAPLHDIAEAILAWLVATYRVSVADDPSIAADHARPMQDVRRAVRVTPDDPDAAPLTIVWTGFPGIRVHAGILFDAVFPSCGCDACDEEWESVAHELEWTTRAIVDGGFSESDDPDLDLSIGFALDEPGVAARSGRSRAQDHPVDRVALLGRERRWAPWPVR